MSMQEDARGRQASTTPQFGHDSYRQLHQPSADYTPSPFANHDSSADCLSSAPLPRLTRGGVRGAASDLAPGDETARPQLQLGRTVKEPESRLSLFFAFAGRVRTPWACCISFLPSPFQAPGNKQTSRSRAEGNDHDGRLLEKGAGRATKRRAG